jgi:hypothetical protein
MIASTFSNSSACYVLHFLKCQPAYINVKSSKSYFLGKLNCSQRRFCIIAAPKGMAREKWLRGFQHSCARSLLQLQQRKHKTLAVLCCVRISYKALSLCSLLAHFFNVCNMWCTYSGVIICRIMCLSPDDECALLLCSVADEEWAPCRSLTILFCTTRSHKSTKSNKFPLFLLITLLIAYKVILNCPFLQQRDFQAAYIVQLKPHPPVDSKS